MSDLSSRKRIEKFLRRAVLESFDELGLSEEDERKVQDKLAKDLKGLSSSSSSKEGVEEAEGDEAPDSKEKAPIVPSDEEEEATEEVADATVEDVIAKLNVMRSGQSLKDDAVKSSLKDYWGGLQVGERQSMYVFLDGLSQIMAAGAEGKEVPDPGAVGIKVKAKRKAPPSSVRSTGSEDAPETGDTPIVVGEVASKAYELSILKENM